ncbi:MAG: hypothetical protein KTR24_05520 [Saprospiraceae bacterium]|nr:hypothetical protein [Saprospiraceae bacterium]
MKLSVEKSGVRMGHTAAVYCLEHFDDESFLSAGGDGLIVRWHYQDEEDGRALAKIEEQIFSLLYVAEHNLVVCGAFSGHLYFVDLAHPEEPRRFEFHQKGVYSLAYVDGKIVAGGGDGKVSFWNPLTLRIEESIAISHEAIRCIYCNPPSDALMLGCSDAAIYEVDRGNRLVRQVMAAAHDPSVFTVLADEVSMWSGGRDAKIRIWSRDHEGWTTDKVLDAHWYTVNQLLSIWDNKLVASASRDKTLRLWDRSTFQPMLTIDRMQHQGHVNSVNRMLWQEESQFLVSAGDDRQIIIWQLSALR